MLASHLRCYVNPRAADEGVVDQQDSGHCAAAVVGVMVGGQPCLSYIHASSVYGEFGTLPTAAAGATLGVTLLGVIRYGLVTHAGADAPSCVFDYERWRTARHRDAVIVEGLDVRWVKGKAVGLAQLQALLTAGYVLSFSHTLCVEHWFGPAGGRLALGDASCRPVSEHASHSVAVVGFTTTPELPAGSSCAVSKIGDRSEGDFLFKNSWGLAWGDSGYGWLPYESMLDYVASLGVWAVKRYAGGATCVR